MGVRRYHDLVAWQLCMELHDRIVALTDREPVRRDRKFCSQILDASSNCAPNIAEGFARFVPTEFKQFLRYALASLAETQTRLDQA